jgi:RNA polymerase sigma-70 factor (ECF subfamily)
MSKRQKKSRNQQKEFEELTLPHMNGLMRVALKMTGNKEEAEDLVQETYLKAFRAFDRFEWGTNVRAWMFRIMINTHYNVHRHRKIFKDIEESSHSHWINMEVVSQEAMRAFKNPESSLQQRLVMGEIHAAVENLPQEYRVIFMLSDVEGFSYKEVAETVGCPIGTVMSRLHRARRMLQTALLGKDIFEKTKMEEEKAEDSGEDQAESNVVPFRSTQNL